MGRIYVPKGNLKVGKLDIDTCEGRMINLKDIRIPSGIYFTVGMEFDFNKSDLSNKSNGSGMALVELNEEETERIYRALRKKFIKRKTAIIENIEKVVRRRIPKNR